MFRAREEEARARADAAYRGGAAEGDGAVLPVVVVPFVPLPAVHPRQLPRSVVRGQRGPAVTPVYPFTTGFRPGELPPPDRVGRPVIMTFPPGEIPPPDRVSPPPR